MVVRNRRIGVGIIDWTGWVHDCGMYKVTSYMRKGYDTVVRVATERASESGVPAPIRFTTIKPGGTGPKLPGKTPGIGHPTYVETLRRMRVATNNPICIVLDTAGVPYQSDYFNPENTRVYEYPTKQGPARPADQVPLWEQAMNLVTVQREWSDNAVSNTLYFRPKWKLIMVRESSQPVLKGMDTPEDHDREFRNQFPLYVTEALEGSNYEELFAIPAAFKHEDEKEKIVCKKNKYGVWELSIFVFDPNHEEEDIERVLSSIAPLIKSCSLLPHSAKGAYRQMPEEGISPSEYEARLKAIKPIDWTLFGGSDGEDEKYCTGETCVIPQNGSNR